MTVNNTLDKDTKKSSLKDELKDELEKVKLNIKEFRYAKHDGKLWESMVNHARELHKIVKPKHHKYMIRNRECKPDRPEFYDHIHPIEDLLEYMDDPRAFDEPDDQTLDHEFKLKIFTLRWGHDDVYILKRISDGWYFDHKSFSGYCNKSGEPYFFNSLRHDGVNYPIYLSYYIKELWELAKKKGLSHEEVQKHMDKLGEWISVCEKHTPEGIYK